jgi:hypothetical protein
MRRVEIGLAALAAFGVMAGGADAANKLVEAGKVFPLASNYLKLPPAERSRFTAAYYLKAGGQPLSVPAWIVADGKRTPLPLDANGKVGRLPTLAELDHGKLELGIDAAAKVQITLGIEPLTAPATDLDAHELAEAIAQAAVGSKKAAGILALAMPKLDDVVFVGAGSGEIEFADGHRAPLPIVKGQPTYAPAAQPGAKRIRLAKTPMKLDID